MEDHYLNILELSSGASKKEIKSAYRKLSKKYHPDVNKDEMAKERFIEINEAYKFLIDDDPKYFDESFYDAFNSYEDEIEIRRQKAREFARQQAEEAMRQQNNLIQKILQRFIAVLGIILIINTLLAIDYLLPTKEEVLPISGYTNVSAMGFKGENYHYDEIYFEDIKMKIDVGSLLPTEEYKSALVEYTPILRKPMAATIQNQGVPVRIVQVYNIYRIFGAIIPIIFTLSALFLLVLKSPEHRLTISIFILFLFAIQLFLLFFS